MNLARVNAIYRKDLRDALRDSRLIIAILMPLLIGLLYSFMFKDDTKPTAKLGVIASVSTQLPAALQAATQAALQLKVQTFADRAALTQQVRDKKVDVGLVIPSGFDAALKSGASPKLTVILPASPSFGGDYVAAILDRVTQSLAGQAPAATIARVTSPPRPGPPTRLSRPRRTEDLRARGRHPHDRHDRRLCAAGGTHRRDREADRGGAHPDRLRRGGHRRQVAVRPHVLRDLRTADARDHPGRAGERGALRRGHRPDVGGPGRPWPAPGRADAHPDAAQHLELSRPDPLDGPRDRHPGAGTRLGRARSCPSSRPRRRCGLG